MSDHANDVEISNRRSEMTIQRNRRSSADVYSSKRSVVDYLRTNKKAPSSVIIKALNMDSHLGHRQIAAMVGRGILRAIPSSFLNEQKRKVNEYEVARGGIKRLNEMYGITSESKTPRRPRLTSGEGGRSAAVRPAFVAKPQTVSGSQGIEVSGPYLTISIGGESHTVDFETGRELYDSLTKIYGTQSVGE